MSSHNPVAHCSNHEYHFRGCDDCTTAEKYRMHVETRLEKGYAFIVEPKIDIGRPSPKIQMVRQQLFAVMKIFLSAAAERVSKAAGQKARQLRKAADDDEEILRAALRAMQWDDIIQDVSADLGEASAAGAVDGAMQLGVDIAPLQPAINEAALDYARTRAAEMVGRTWVGNKLVDNPDPKWAISDTTRDDLRDIIARTFQGEVKDLENEIMLATTFDEARAEMIARTEIAIAQVQGNLGLWRQTGMVKSVNILLSANHAVTDECDSAAEGGPYPIDDMPYTPPMHPQCQCVIMAAEIGE